jgi:enamine deaminase RidA (YjgF/YER057c/UK114 family)
MDAVDAVLTSIFSDYVPAQTAVAVAALPMNALVQVEALVSHGEGTIPGMPQGWRPY